MDACAGQHLEKLGKGKRKMALPVRKQVSMNWPGLDGSFFPLLRGLSSTLSESSRELLQGKSSFRHKPLMQPRGKGKLGEELTQKSHNHH